MIDITKEEEKKIEEELMPIDMEERYKNYLDEVFSFESVGPPFSHMSPAKVLEEVDLIAYKYGLDDFIDGEEFETVIEVNGEYYNKQEVLEVLANFDEEGDIWLNKIRR